MHSLVLRCFPGHYRTAISADHVHMVHNTGSTDTLLNDHGVLQATIAHRVRIGLATECDNAKPSCSRLRTRYLICEIPEHASRACEVPARVSCVTKNMHTANISARPSDVAFSFEKTARKYRQATSSLEILSKSSTNPPPRSAHASSASQSQAQTRH